MSAISIASSSVDDTAALASRLAKLVRAGDCLALSGEVGAGKTTFAQAFLKPLLKADEPVTSPTFTLVQAYETREAWHVYHADLYRLRHASEFTELGLEEAFHHHVTFIEWPEIAFPMLPDDTLFIAIDYVSEHARSISLRSDSPAWQSRLKEFAS